MKTMINSKVLPLIVTVGVALSVNAQVATIDVSSPTNPVVTYDANPYIYAPDLPPDPTAIYLDALTLPTASDITSQNTLALEYAALVDAGSFEGLVGIEFGAYEAQEPVVQQSDTPPDTYSLTPATIYYTAPTNNPPTVATANSGPFYFDFGGPSSPVESGYTQITPASAYSASTGYGWGDTSKVSYRDRGSPDNLRRDFCMPQTPFYVDLSNGTYDVSVLVGDAAAKTGLAVRGNGLLELYNMRAPSDHWLQQEFPITITNNRLRLEFISSISQVDAITIVRDDKPHKPTIFVASDSTAAAYTEYDYPLTGWGDRMQMYMSSNAVVDDQAKAGRSSKSFVEEGALDTIVNRIHTNDYLFVMMAINDSASKDPSRDTSPATTFKAYLRLYVNAARSHGAYPVFVTSQTKRTFDVYGRFFNSVGGYPQAMRELGQELNVPVIDLNAKSINLFDVVGPEATTNMFRILAGNNTWPNYPNGYYDYIHFQDRGATALGKQVVDGIRELNLPIAKDVLPVLQPAFQPAIRSAYQ
ncbi:MAG TPA: GDSL-type esterase/lipase family protein [Verrucomicrobiae bacterium]|nr:GDSL-type esterase/lipase family protein [Verrucomicrobiae bacterium]